MSAPDQAAAMDLVLERFTSQIRPVTDQMILSITDEYIFDRRTKLEPERQTQMLEKLSRSFGEFEQYFVRNKGNYVSGSKQTYVDIVLYNELDAISSLFE